MDDIFEAMDKAMKQFAEAADAFDKALKANATKQPKTVFDEAVDKAQEKAAKAVKADVNEAWCAGYDKGCKDTEQAIMQGCADCLSDEFQAFMAKYTKDIQATATKETLLDIAEVLTELANKN